MLRRLLFRKPIREVKLGRWDHKNNKLQEDIKSAWTNSDHCGDSICGKPAETKEIIYKSLGNIKNIENKNRKD